jgi:hypothetical protein
VGRQEIGAVQNLGDQPEQSDHVSHRFCIILIVIFLTRYLVGFPIAVFPTLRRTRAFRIHQISQAGKLGDMDLLEQMGGDPEQSQLADEDFTIESWELRPEGLAQVVLLLFFCFHL